VATRTSTAVATRFDKLLVALQPSARDVERTQKHVSTIRTRIQSRFEVSKTLWVGSHAKQTAIRSISDVDLFVVLRRDELKRGDGYVQPKTLLKWLRDELDACFRQTWVGRDGMAVVVAFGQGQHSVDVVPAMYLGQHPSGMPLFDIPHPENRWLTTSPEAHQRFFRNANERTGRRLQRIVQLIKHWLHSRAKPIPLQSFHIEMVLAAAGLGLMQGSYSDHLANALRVLAIRNGAALRDPLGISGNIPAANTDVQREVVKKALKHAASHAIAATHAEQQGDTQEAIRQWQIVFNDAFPR
jgi:hypothetical protein